MLYVLYPRVYPYADNYVVRSYANALSTLKRTVFASGLHCPAVMMSPSLGSKAGLQCTAMLLCLQHVPSFESIQSVYGVLFS